MTHPAGHHALRKGRVTIPGQIYLLTTVTADRLPHFLDIALARAACRSMIELKTWGDADLICWVLMPDHWHGLIALGERDNLSLVMNRLKSLTRKALARAGYGGDVWARGFHDHALRKDEDIHAAARYIIANPIRAGLVADANDYPYWNCAWLL
jgi:putative transposase